MSPASQKEFTITTYHEPSKIIKRGRRTTQNLAPRDILSISRLTPSLNPKLNPVNVKSSHGVNRKSLLRNNTRTWCYLQLSFYLTLVRFSTLIYGISIEVLLRRQRHASINSKLLDKIPFLRWRLSWGGFPPLYLIRRKCSKNIFLALCQFAKSNDVIAMVGFSCRHNGLSLTISINANRSSTSSISRITLAVICHCKSLWDSWNDSLRRS